MDNMQIAELSEENRRINAKIVNLQGENQKLIALFKEGQSALKNQALERK